MCGPSFVDKHFRDSKKIVLWLTVSAFTAILTMELASPEISKQENQNANPWPIIDSTQKCENSFENNFTRAQKDELNENGLSLPDYTHHLNLLGKQFLQD